MNFDHEEEMIRMWQQSSGPGSGDAAQLAREIVGTIEKFDRRILWRNARECVAGAAVLVFLLWQMMSDPTKRPLGAAGLVAVAFMMIGLWRGQRGTPQPDPGADAQSYQTALLDRYDKQIRALRRARWSYVFPAYLWMVLVVVNAPGRSPLRRLMEFLVVTAFSSFVVWLNENYAVRKLRAAREKAESMLQGPE